MNDELTPDERAALRSRILGGARDIRPAGAHRNAWIAGSIAAVLVVAIAGGAVATSTLSAPQIADTPTPHPTATAAPVVPTPSPTRTRIATTAPTASTPALAFDGDCSRVLDDAAVSRIAGRPMSRSPYGLFESDVAVLGGISCEWAATNEGYDTIGVSVIPWGAVPESVRETAGVVPPCEGGFTCFFSERYGDALVTAWAGTADLMEAAVREVGPRASQEPGQPRTVPEGAWRVPDCATVQAVFREVLPGDPITPYSGDTFPHGAVWDVLTSAKAAGWCAVTVDEGADFLTRVDVNFAPGQEPDLARIRDRGGYVVDVAGAESAWIAPSTIGSFRSLIASDGSNWLSVETDGLDETEMVALAEALLGALR